MTAAQYIAGMGQTDSSNNKQGLTTAQYASLGVSAGTSIVGIAASNLPVSTKVESSTGTALLTAAAVPSPASPFLAIAGGIASLLGAFGVGSGCGQTCVLSSDYANQAEALLKQNIQIYEALPTPRPMSLQQEALSNFSTIWSDLVQQCSNPSLGNAGKRCIGDRQRGGKFNWFGWYRDPIANDTNVYNDTQSAQLAQAVGTQVTSTSPVSASIPTSGNVSTVPFSLSSIIPPITSSNLPTYLIIGGVGVVLLVMAFSKP